MYTKLRKFLAVVALLSSAASAWPIGAAILGALEGVGGARPADLMLGAVFTILGGLAGVRLLDDRPGGVPLSLLFFGCQIVAVSLPFNARYWAVTGPYMFVMLGTDGLWAGLGLTVGGASVPALRHSPSWVGVNIFALAAFWFLWRRPWRKQCSPQPPSESAAPVAY